MTDLTQEKKSFKDRLPDLFGALGSAVIFFVAYLVFTDKLPPNIKSYFAYFYIIGIAGALGLLGEKASVTLLAFLLPVLLGGATLILRFKPERYPVEDWWGIYSILVLFSAGFLAFLFYRFEQNKNLGSGKDENLKARVNPNQAARYREEQNKKSEVHLGGGLPNKVEQKGKKGESAKDKAKNEQLKADGTVETAEERMEREMREIKEGFGRRSMRLTTTLMRIKNLTKSLDRDEIFNNILDVITKGMDATRVQLLLNDDKEGKLKIVKAIGMKPREYKDIVISHEEDSMITYLLKQRMNEVTGGAAALGVKECEMDPKTKGLIGQGVIKSIIVAPIYLEGKVFAMINVEKMKNPDYSRDDTNLIATCADVSGLVMKNARLYSATIEDLVSAKQLSEDHLKKNEELRGSLSRIVSPSVAEMIMTDPSGLKLGGSKSEVTMFFSDIRGFTKMSENMDPTDIVEQLNVYFTRMTDILMELEGTLDKYVGDELMALFGAPVSREDDPIRAVLCGVRMFDALRELQKVWKKEGKPIIDIGIGINTGIVTAGYMGSEKQLSYTVIGDSVNIAARVMSVAKPMELFITRSTYERVAEYFEIEQREAIVVKGKSMPIEIFQVHRVKPGVDLSEFAAQGTGSIARDMSPQKPPAEDTPVRVEPQLSEEDSKLNIQIDDSPKVIECQQCGTENDMQEKFCIKCGMPIF